MNKYYGCLLKKHVAPGHGWFQANFLSGKNITVNIVKTSKDK